MSFEPGEINKTVVVPIADDLILEDDELFTATLISTEQNVIVDNDRSNADITILDNDREFVVYSTLSYQHLHCQVVTLHLYKECYLFLYIYLHYQVVTHTILFISI